jgi:hypothetical protein
MAELPTLDDYVSNHMAPAEPDDARCPICWGPWDYPAQEVIESSPVCHHRFHKACLLWAFGISADSIYAVTNLCPLCRRTLFRLPPTQYRATHNFLLAWLDTPEGVGFVGGYLNTIAIHSANGDPKILVDVPGKTVTMPWYMSFMNTQECKEALDDVITSATHACQSQVPSECCLPPNATACFFLRLLMSRFAHQLSPMGWSYLNTKSTACYLVATEHEKTFLQASDPVRYEMSYDSLLGLSLELPLGRHKSKKILIALDDNYGNKITIESYTVLKNTTDKIVCRIGDSEAKLEIWNDRLVVEDQLPGGLNFIDTHSECPYVVFTTASGRKFFVLVSNW